MKKSKFTEYQIVFAIHQFISSAKPEDLKRVVYTIKAGSTLESF